MKYKNPCSTADIIVERENKVLLIRRKHKPFKGKWALPGGHLNYGVETLEQTAVRELEEETGIMADKNKLKLFGVYSEPGRDPRGHYITHVYIAGEFNGQPAAGDDAGEVGLFHLKNLPELAFDHERILGDYMRGHQKV